MASPIQPAQETGQPDTIDTGEPTRGRSRKGLIAAGAAAGLVGLVAAGAWAVNSYVGLGLGDRPEAAVPADAVAFVRLDLDPAATEKLDALRFLRQFEVLDGKLPGDDVDLRRWLVEQLDPAGEQVDFDRDLAPWLGERVGVAVMPGLDDEGAPLAAAVVQTTDEQAARDALGRLTKDDADAIYAVRDGWAYIAPSQAALDAVMAQDGDSLADSAAFGDAMEEIGDEAVAVGYVDLDGLAALVEKGAETNPELGSLAPGMFGMANPAASMAQYGGQLSFGLQFEPDAVEVKAAVTGAEGMVVAEIDEATLLSSLPETTLGGLQFAGLGENFMQQWDSVLEQMSTMAGQMPLTLGSDGDGAQIRNPRDMIEEQIAAFEEETGLRIPEDVEVMLGQSLLLGVDAEGITSETPKVGAVVKTDAQRAQEVIDALLAYAERMGEPVPAGVLTTKADGDLFRIGSDEAYVTGLGEGDGLRNSDRFTAAVPDADNAQLALWLDLDRIYDLIVADVGAPTGEDATFAQILEVSDALGISSITADESSSSIAVRWTTD